MRPVTAPLPTSEPRALVNREASIAARGLTAEPRQGRTRFLRGLLGATSTQRAESGLTAVRQSSRSTWVKRTLEHGTVSPAPNRLDER